MQNSANSRVRNSYRDQVRDVITHRINTGEYSPGYRIVEATIASEMRISSIPVREAIRELIGLGLLDFTPHKGASVRSIGFTDTIDALEIRSVLEPLAAVRAMPWISGKTRKLRKAAEAIVASAKRRDFVGFSEHNHVFHRTIVEASASPLLLKQWELLIFDVRAKYIMDFIHTVDPVAIALEHLAITEAFEAADLGCARRLLASHSNGLVKYLKRERQLAGQPRLNRCLQSTELKLRLRLG